RRAAHDEFAGLPELMRFGALTEHVVEDDHVRPWHVRHPIVGFWNEAVGDLTLARGLAEQLHFVAFFDDLPGDIGDQPVERDEEEFLFVKGCSRLWRIIKQVPSLRSGQALRSR